MYESDREYFSRFALDPETEYGFEELYSLDFSVEEEEMTPVYDEKDSDAEDSISEDDFFFEI